MNGGAAGAPDRRNLWLGAPGSDDSRRSEDEIRIIKAMVSEEVEMFLGSNNIDTAAAKELRSEPPHVVLAVLNRGPLRSCTNPSGTLVSRIRDAKRGILTQPGGRMPVGGGARPSVTLDPANSEADRFLLENRIDEAGIASFRSESQEVQKMVMAKGPLVNTTNPSASLMARIRNVKVNAHSNPVLTNFLAGQAAQQQLQLQHNPGALALQDSHVASFAISDEAQKAINKLTLGPPPGAPPFGVPPLGAPGGAPSMMAPPPALGGGFGGPAMQPGVAPMINDEDKRLQAEALMAMQAINSADL